MYAVSEAYKTAIASGAPTTRMTGTITLADASTISITDSLLVMGTTSLQEQAVESDEIMLGTCWATEFDAELKTNANLAGAKVEPIFGLQVDGPITNLVTTRTLQMALLGGLLLAARNLFPVASILLQATEQTLP
jgi:hypothetical protein